jgi:hypothetical protein
MGCRLLLRTTTTVTPGISASDRSAPAKDHLEWQSSANKSPARIGPRPDLMADRNSAINRAAQSPGARRQNTGSGSETAAAGRKRDSRAGTRKVTSLTAVQLERKRANDREAQRTIRQRTREHIENLEHQVAELSAKGEQMDQVIQRNAALEAEIAHLRQQLTIMSSSRPLYPGRQEPHPP